MYALCMRSNPEETNVQRWYNCKYNVLQHPQWIGGYIEVVKEELMLVSLLSEFKIVFGEPCFLKRGPPCVSTLKVLIASLSLSLFLFLWEDHVPGLRPVLCWCPGRPFHPGNSSSWQCLGHDRCGRRPGSHTGRPEPVPWIVGPDVWSDGFGRHHG